jgi:hypothetical protein
MRILRALGLRWDVMWYGKSGLFATVQLIASAAS